jgi:hypothetical protein
LPAVSHDPEYEQFIEATGLQFERDLKRLHSRFIMQQTPGGKPAPPCFSKCSSRRYRGIVFDPT